jgi:purine nucleosidase
MVHGDDGLGGKGPPDVAFELLAESAPETIGRLAREHPGELTLVAVGPLTNVALALRADPSLTANLDSLVVMGGAIHPPGNVTPVAEFNIASDPEAAAEVVAAPWSRPPLLVPLDVTHLATLSGEEKRLVVQERTPAARFLAGPIDEYWSRTAVQTSDGTCPSHDLVALMAAAHPEILEVEEVPLAVDTGGSAGWGQTVADLRVRILARGALPAELVDLARRELLEGRSIWRVALGADVERFRARVRPMLGA